MASAKEKTAPPAPASQSTICKTCNVQINSRIAETHKLGRRHKFLEKARMSHVGRSTRWIHVTELPLGVGSFDLIEYFSKYGIVTSSYFPRNKTYCFVEFSRPASSLKIFNQTHWFADKQIVISKIPGGVAKTNKRRDFYTGNDVMLNINPKATIENQIKAFLDCSTLGDEELLVRERFAAMLTGTLQELIPGSRVEIFGSAANGMAFADNDLDVSFFLPFERAEREMVSLPEQDIPTAQDIILAKFPKENLTHLKKDTLLHFLSNYFFFLPGFKYCHFCMHNGFSSVKLTHGPSNLRVSFSIGKSLGLASTQLLQLYGQLDFYIYGLLMVLRYWAKREQFVGDGRNISSYAFYWLVIFYLQRKSLAPTVQKLASLSDLSVEAENWDCSFTENIDDIPVGTKDKSFGELITGFFQFYSVFDFDANVICPRDGTSIPKSELTKEAGEQLDFELTVLSVQDVFELTRNITSSVSGVSLARFKTKCAQQLIIWQNMIKNRNVCLKMLLDSKLGNEEILNKIQSSVSMTISLSSHDLGLAQYDVHEVCNFILDIYRRVFLFRCTVIKTGKGFKVEGGNLTLAEENASKRPKMDEKVPVFIGEIKCNVCHRIWARRKNFHVDSAPLTGTQRLDYEEQISREVIKSDSTSDETTLYTFHTKLTYRSEKLELVFEAKSAKNELIHTVMPFVKKHISTLADVSLKSYLTSK